MEITRHILFFLILHIWAFYCYANVTSFKKKKASTKPHGRHVANKGGRSILFDPHGWNKTESKVSPVAVVSIKGSPHEQETRIVSVHSMEKLRRREEKRRRRKKKHKLMRKLKRWREQIYPASALGNQYQYPKKECRNWIDCKKDECCIRTSSTSGYCKKRPQKGQRCRPILLPGLRDCPCDVGLTCTSYKKAKRGLKHRCERLIMDPRNFEVEQRNVSIQGNTQAS